MPISQNEKMALNVLRPPKFKYREIGDQYADTLKQVAEQSAETFRENKLLIIPNFFNRHLRCVRRKLKIFDF